MKEPVQVQVSPFIQPAEWTDGLSGVTFKRDVGKITIPFDVDITNILRYIQLNFIYVVNGNIEDCRKVEKPKREPKPEPQVIPPTPEQLKVEPPKVEVKVEEPKVEEPKVEEPAEAPAEKQPEAPKAAARRRTTTPKTN